MHSKTHVGDVFLVPIDRLRFAVGQVAGDWKGELYIVIYNAVHEDRAVDPQSVHTEEPLFAALSLDAKLYRADWPVIGNVTENLSRLPQPAFKIKQGDEVFVESRDRSRCRRATDAEAKLLMFRTVVAPVRLEAALRAKYGVGEWRQDFNDLLATYAQASSQLMAD